MQLPASKLPIAKSFNKFIHSINSRVLPSERKVIRQLQAIYFIITLLFGIRKSSNFPIFLSRVLDLKMCSLSFYESIADGVTIMGLLEVAAATMKNGERQMEVAAQNATNAETPGYKAQVAFNELRDEAVSVDQRPSAPKTAVHTAFAQGTIFPTGNTLDLAINGSGFFLVRNGDQYALTRAGSFGITSDGTLADPQGRTLQLVTGGDATTSTYALEVLADGTMLDGTSIMGTIGLFEAPHDELDRSLSQTEMEALEQADGSEIQQAMLERSNVMLSNEMVELMKAQRQVESGAQLIRTYDQLLDRAINTFGRSS